MVIDSFSSSAAATLDYLALDLTGRSEREGRGIG